ncbi:MAG: AAA family ATPase [Acholeplasmataceae bacterium]|nr:AAA family ATPase [Acholeplasmataceae bacterium]
MNHISIEGFDGVGKTTICKMLSKRLEYEFIEKPLKYLFDTDGEEKEYIRIRDYINQESPKNRPLSAAFYGFGNIFLYHKFKNKNIITDRHILSNYAWSYDKSSEKVYEVLYDLLGEPKHTFILKGSKEVIKERLLNRNHSDSDLLKLDFLDTVYDKMIQYATKYNMDYYIINTDNKSPQVIVEEIIGIIEHKNE